MKKRDFAFVLIGLGTGLMLSCVELVLFLRRMFIVDIRLNPGLALLALPFLFIFAGAILLFRTKSHPQR